MKKTNIIIEDGCPPLDPLCIPFIDYFNSIGLRTIESCQGHEIDLEQPYEAGIFRNGMFYIIFDEFVSDEDIISFVKPHGRGAFLKGNFVKWISGGRLLWMYCLGDKDCKNNQANAEKDFEAFMADNKEKYWDDLWKSYIDKEINKDM